MTEPAPSEGAPTLARFGPFTLDLKAGVLRRGEERLHLQPAAFELLCLLVKSPGRLFTRKELMSLLWPGVYVGEEALTQMIRRLRKVIEADGRDPEWIMTVPRRGYRLDGEVRWGSDASSPQAPAPPGPAPFTATLPVEVDAFFGREDALHALGEALGQGARLVTILGPGGIGKTRLAVHFARRGGEAHGPALFVDLSEARDPDSVALLLGGILDAPVIDEASGANLDRIGRALGATGARLIVLDNFESIQGLAAETVGRWLHLAPEARFLVTSRERLAIAGERILPLGPLGADAARALFLGRAQAAGAHVPDGPGGADEVTPLVERLDLSPLAIELAAGRAAVMSVPQLSERLTRRFQLLTSRRADLPERQRSLRTVVEDSVSRLGPELRQALTAFTRLTGPVSLDTAEGLVAAEGAGEDAGWIPDRVQDLVDRSLLRLLPQAGLAPVFSLQESVRDYLRESAPPLQGEALDALRALVLQRLTSLLGEARASLEVATLLDAARRLDGPAPWRARVALTAAPWLRERGPRATGRALVDAALGAGDLPPELKARLLLERALLLPLGSDPHQAALALAVEEARAHGLASLAQEAHLHALDEAARRGSLKDALRDLPPPEALRGAPLPSRLHAETLRLRITWGLGGADADALLAGPSPYLPGPLADGDADPPDPLRPTAHLLASARARLANERAHLYNEVGRYSDAVACHEEALAVYRRLGWRRQQGVNLTNVSSAWSFSGHPEEAARALDEALGIFEEIGEAVGLCACLTNRSLAALLDGRLSDARRDVERALGLAEETGYAAARGVLLQNRATIAWLEGDLAVALDAVADGLKGAEAAAMGTRVSQLLLWRAGLMTCLGRVGEARADLDRAHEGLAGAEGGRHQEALKTVGRAVERAEAEAGGDAARVAQLDAEAARMHEEAGPQARLLMTALATRPGR